MRPEEKKEELNHLKSFLNVLDPDLVKSLEENEKPDAAISKDDSKIGVEHTRIMQPETIDGLRVKREEAMRDRVLHESEKKFRDSSAKNVHVDISFDDFYWLNYPQEEWGSQEYHKLPEAISNFVLDNIPPEDETIRITRPSDGFIEDYIWYLTISHFDNGDEAKWSRPRGGSVPLIGYDIIEEIVDSKNQKSEDYDQTCEDFWLVMIKNDFDYSMTVQLSEELVEHKYQSNFARIFIFDIATHELIELNVA